MNISREAWRPDTLIESALPMGPRLGSLLLEQGKLKSGDAERIVEYATQKQIPFGQAAIKMGLVSLNDVERALATQFDYPYLALSDKSLGAELDAAYRPFSRAVEALRGVRSRLVLRYLNATRKTLAIVSPNRSDGRSYVAANLAILFAQSSERTLLIDGDLRQPRQGTLFGCAGGPGLAGWLIDRNGEEAIQPVAGLRGLYILPAGATPPNPQELLSRSAFADVLQTCCDRFDVILIDTPAGTGTADAQLLAARAHGCMMVARRNRSRLNHARDFSERLRADGAQLVGAIVNDA